MAINVNLAFEGLKGIPILHYLFIKNCHSLERKKGMLILTHQFCLVQHAIIIEGGVYMRLAGLTSLVNQNKLCQ